MTPLDEKVLVAGQIEPASLQALAEYGVTMIVNNRPDHEEPGQPTSADMEKAAQAAGLGYRHIPVAGGLSPDQVARMAEAIDAADGKLLAFCKSGTRSTWLWALARSQQGEAADSLIEKAAAAGYSLEPLRPYL
jgi:uncharacterized protein (TIGR01244 family)